MKHHPSPNQNAPSNSANSATTPIADATPSPLGIVELPDFLSETAAPPSAVLLTAAACASPGAAAVFSSAPGMVVTPAMNALTITKLLEELSYESSTGEFRWLISRGNARVGALAGTINSRGYRMIKIMNHWYAAHRLVWLVERGAWPTKFIDHVDGNPLNNLIANLREATNLQNQGNAVHRGYTVVQHKTCVRYHSRIRINGVAKYLGSFATPEAATAAYRAAHEGHFGEFSATRRAEVLSNAELQDRSSFLRRARPAHDAIEPDVDASVISKENRNIEETA